MEEIEWKEFIVYLIEKGKKVNLKKECANRNVGLNTLYRKVNNLKEIDNAIYKKFMLLHPYIPRDIEMIDFENLMRESIIFGISQKELEHKYKVTKRTIQRKFSKIRITNPELFELYQRYLVNKDEEMNIKIVDEALEGYERQNAYDVQQQLLNRKNKFMQRIEQLKDESGTLKKQARNYYKEGIKRIDNQQEINEEERE